MYETQILIPKLLASHSAVEPISARRIQRHDARALTDGAGTALIELDGQIYTLRITKSAKLILTK